jgi:hypothetical protein
MRWVSLGLFALCCPAPVQAEVFSSSLRLSAPTPGYRPYEWGIVAFTGPDFSGQGAGFGLDLSPSYPNLSGFDMYARDFTLGIKFNCFIVKSGASFGPSYVRSHTPFANNYSPEMGPTSLQLDRVYYMGIWMDDNPEGPTPAEQQQPGPGDAFGWAAFSYDGTTFTVLENAIENSGAGIRIGSMDVLPSVVPEPSAAALFLLGMGWMLNGRLRRASLTRPLTK